MKINPKRFPTQKWNLKIIIWKTLKVSEGPFVDKYKVTFAKKSRNIFEHKFLETSMNKLKHTFAYYFDDNPENTSNPENKIEKSLQSKKLNAKEVNTSYSLWFKIKTICSI